MDYYYYNHYNNHYDKKLRDFKNRLRNKRMHCY